ncbi:MAG: hypothetical protein ACR2O6_15870 [Ilumatobacteraceae bacterium]
MAPRTYATLVAPGLADFLGEWLDERGWVPAANHTDWNLHWSYPVQPSRTFRALDDSRRISHFPGIGPMVFKDEMYRHLVRAGRSDFLPRTFSMPDDLAAWREAVAADPDAIWISKRKWSGNGDGIAMVTDPDDVPTTEDWLIQEYIANPLLLAGHPSRHVIRVYVLITSLDPLVAYLHRSAMITFTSRPYSRDRSTLADPITHITSAPIQRGNTEVDDPLRSIDQVEYGRRLSESGIEPGALWDDIRRLVTDTVVALSPPVLRLSSVISDRLDCCFELLGYDLVVDDELAVWLLEINKGPGIGATAGGGSSQQAQRRVKNAVVGDVLGMVGAAEPRWPVGLHAERFDVRSTA